MNPGVRHLAKVRNSRRVRLGVTALIAALVFTFLSILQFSSLVGPRIAYGSELVSSQVDVSAPPKSDLLPGEKLTVYLKAKFKARVVAAKIKARKATAAKAALARARQAKISRNYTRPVSNYRLTASFGERSRLWSGSAHTGQDFAAPYGTPVKAAEAGTVVFAGWDGPYGWKIAIAHVSGVQTWYGHLSRINVKVGQHVKVGQFIGRVGASGNVTGAHLHFEVRRYNIPINPVKWLRTMGIRV